MNGFVTDRIDYDEFVGRAVEGIGYTAATVLVSFTGDVSITSYNFVHTLVEGKILSEGPRDYGGALPRFLERIVTAVSVGESELALEFENGAAIRFIDDDPRYEVAEVSVGTTSYYV